MKRVFFLLTILLVFFLYGCHATTFETNIQVTLLETKGCTIHSNGIWVAPGESATFLLDMERGYSLASTDYSGSYSISTKGRQTTVTLENVQYPTQVALKLTNRYCAITYEANGGAGQAQTITYDTDFHMRPNTSIGTDIFSRDGYTLTSWNTAPDGSGERIGLGSRVSVGEELTLYAQWEKWEASSAFTYTAGDVVTITDYHGSAEILAIPETIDGKPVKIIAAGAFKNCEAKEVILPKSLDIIENSAFNHCALDTVTLFDHIITISDRSFLNCPNLKTLRINAIEPPYGYAYRKESCYADKIDLLIEAHGTPKLVCYGGCSMWYNLDGHRMKQAFGDHYTVINMGLNGTVNSFVQMQIIEAFLESGDILFHTPEISSKTQLLVYQDMNHHDNKLWCGLEYNFDLFALVDLQTVSGVFDSLCGYLSMKDTATSYRETYTDDSGQTYCDRFGCIPFFRSRTDKSLPDRVFLDPSFIEPSAMARLQQIYSQYQSRGVRIYLSYACINIDAVPEKQKGNVELMDCLFRESIEAMEGPVLISNLNDYLYHTNDFFDTNYHLLSKSASVNTDLWIRDLQAQLEREAGQ